MTGSPGAYEVNLHNPRPPEVPVSEMDNSNCTTVVQIDFWPRTGLTGEWT